jgi:hypothetical protein
MRQTILIAAALMLVLSAALFAVSPVHAWGPTCPGVYNQVTRDSGFGTGVVAAGAPNGAGQGTYNPLSYGCGFAPANP